MPGLIFVDRIGRLKVELTPEAAQWVEAEVAAGTFATPEDAVRHAIREAKINALRSKLDTAVAEGGRYTSEEMIRRVGAHLDNSNRA